MRVDLEPLMCFATVRKVAAGITKGGIIVPDDSEGADTFIVVHVPKRFLDVNGNWQDTPVKVGDEVMFQPDCPAVQHPLQPKDEFMISIMSIIAKVHRYEDDAEDSPQD